MPVRRRERTASTGGRACVNPARRTRSPPFMSVTTSFTTSELLDQCRDLVAKGLAPSGETPMVVATAGRDGAPNARFVLLKEIDPRGFVFYTNAHSDKGQELAANPRAALVLFWPELGVQLRVQGAAEEVSPEAADAYWRSRGRDSQLASAASRQSETLAGGRDELLARVDALSKQYEGRDIPRPPHWTGYRVVPDRVELWYNRPHRLHDRFRYERQDGETWTRSPLNP